MRGSFLVDIAKWNDFNFRRFGDFGKKIRGVSEK